MSADKVGRKESPCTAYQKPTRTHTLFVHLFEMTSTVSKLLLHIKDRGADEDHIQTEN